MTSDLSIWPLQAFNWLYLTVCLTLSWLLAISTLTYIFLVILFGGSTPSEGNIYAINSEDNFGAVCQDDWGEKETKVLCRQLGYSNGIATRYHYFGKVTGDFVMNNVNCSGEENRIQECPYSTQNNCSGGEARVICVHINEIDKLSQSFNSSNLLLHGSKYKILQVRWRKGPAIIIPRSRSKPKLKTKLCWGPNEWLDTLSYKISWS